MLFGRQTNERQEAANEKEYVMREGVMRKILNWRLGNLFTRPA